MIQYKKRVAVWVQPAALKISASSRRQQHSETWKEEGMEKVSEGRGGW